MTDEKGGSDEESDTDEEGESDDDEEGSKHDNGDDGDGNEGTPGGNDKGQSGDDGDGDNNSDVNQEQSGDGSDEGNNGGDDYYIAVRKGDVDDDLSEEILSATWLLRHMRPLKATPTMYPMITLSGPLADPHIDVGMRLVFQIGTCGSVDASSIGVTYNPPLVDRAE